MRIVKRVQIFFLICLLMGIDVYAQYSGNRPKGFKRDQYGRSLFFYKVYNFADKDDMSLSRAEIHVMFVNDVLTFEKMKNDEFRSKYELSVILYDKKDNPVQDQSITKSITVNSFAETNRRTNPIYHKLSISVPPGEYKYQIQLLCNDDQLIMQRKEEIELRPFQRDRLHLSDIIFAEGLDCSDPGEITKPNLRDFFNSEKSKIAGFFEIYTPAETKNIDVEYTIYDSKERSVWSESLNLSPEKNYIPQCLQLREHINKPGEYTLFVQARYNGQTARLKRHFSVQWRNLSIEENNVDVALDQLDLIAKGREINEMKKATTEEREKLFREFWLKRDPTPGTEENELKDEFFRRIDFSNDNFIEPGAFGKEGWRTDRGRVYIQNGPPTQIEKQPVGMNMPSAEIWYYRKLNKRYIFSDRSGDGRFRLVRVE